MPKIKSKYKPLYSSNKRYFILTGGRGSGKTYVVQDFLVRLLEQVGQGILYTRYTMSAVEKTIIPLFTKHIELVSSLKKYNITKTFIENKETGSFIMFSGIKTSSGDQTANLKTLPNITTWVIEEGEDYNKEDSFVDIDDSIRGLLLQNRIIWIQNPTTREHFVFPKFFEGNIEYREIDGVKYQHCVNPEVEHIHTTYLDNLENLDPKKVAEWRATKLSNPKKYANKYIGAWLDKAEGVIFENWTQGEFDLSLPFLYGSDWGFANDPSTLVKVAVDKKNNKLYLEEKMYGHGMSTQQLTDVFKRVCGDTPIIADNSELRLINEIRANNVNINQVIKKPNSILAGIKKMKGFDIIVCGDSTNLIKELNNYCWIDRGTKTIPIDDHNHILDAVRYSLTRLIP